MIPPMKQNKAMTIAGWIVTALMGVMFIGLSARGKLTGDPQAVEMMRDKFLFPDGVLFPLGVVEVACAVLYLIPQTSILGAVLLTGYLGGATATHVRAGDAFGHVATPVVIGMLVWLGIWLRCARLRGLLPLRLPPHTQTP